MNKDFTFDDGEETFGQNKWEMSTERIFPLFIFQIVFFRSWKDGKVPSEQQDGLLGGSDREEEKRKRRERIE